MKTILLFLFPLAFFISSCVEIYEHSNPVDPKSKEYKDDGTNAHFSIISYNVSRDLSSHEEPYILNISVINDGIGRTESSDGNLYANLKTEPTVSFESPWYSHGMFSNTNKSSNLTDINPKDILVGSFRFTLPENLSIPVNINCSLTLRDRFRNEFIDSIVVNINE